MTHQVSHTVVHLAVEFVGDAPTDVGFVSLDARGGRHRLSLLPRLGLGGGGLGGLGRRCLLGSRHC